MTRTTQALPAEASGTEITRFNALRHGVLSRYTVLPWENVEEYRAVVEALVVEHAPQGPTEEHLVEELAGILWRKRRLRLAEAAAHRRGLEGTLASYRGTVKAHRLDAVPFRWRAAMVCVFGGCKRSLLRSPRHQAVRCRAPVRLPTLLSACLREPAGIGSSAGAWEIPEDPNSAGRKPEHA